MKNMKYLKTWLFSLCVLGVAPSMLCGAVPLHQELLLELAPIESSEAALKFVQDHPEIVSAKSQEGFGVLHLAALKCEDALIDVLMTLGVDVQSKSDEGLSGLHLAVPHCPASTIEKLIQHGASVTEADEDGHTPLHRASINNAKAVDALLAHQANPNTADLSGETPLHHVASIISFEDDQNLKHICESLIGAHADANAVTHEGASVLITAVNHDNMPVIDCLLNAKVDVNAQLGEQQWSALHSAAFNGDLSIVKKLIDAGADPLLKTVDGWTALNLAKNYTDEAHFAVANYLELATQKQRQEQVIEQLKERFGDKVPNIGL